MTPDERADLSIRIENMDRRLQDSYPNQMHAVWPDWNIIKTRLQESPTIEYPTDIDTPETLLVLARMMFEHSSRIGAYDWAVNLKQIMAALFWAAEVKKQMEGEDGQLSNDAGDGTKVS